jgi:hypothetical protein
VFTLIELATVVVVVFGSAVLGVGVVILSWRRRAVNYIKRRYAALDSRYELVGRSSLVPGRRFVVFVGLSGVLIGGMILVVGLLSLK